MKIKTNDTVIVLSTDHYPLEAHSYSLPPRKGLASAVSLQQLDLPTQQTESILQCPVVLTQGPRTKERHLFLFRDWLVVAKQR